MVESSNTKLEQNNMRNFVLSFLGIFLNVLEQEYLLLPVLEQEYLLLPVLEQEYLLLPVLEQEYLLLPVLEQEYLLLPVLEQEYLLLPVLEQEYLLLPVDSRCEFEDFFCLEFIDDMFWFRNKADFMIWSIYLWYFQDRDLSIRRNLES